MKKLRSVVAAIVIASALTACATDSLEVDEPYAITKEKIAQLKSKKSTKEELTRLFGEPEMITPVKGGEVYFFKSLNLNSLWVTFRSDGTVKKIKWSD